MAKRNKKSILIDEGKLSLPSSFVLYKVYAENRKAIRYSLTTKSAYLRIPHQLLKTNSLKGLFSPFKEWVIAQHQKAGVTTTTPDVEIKTNDALRFGKYFINVTTTYTERKSVKGKTTLISLPSIWVKIELPFDFPENQQQEALKKVILKLLGNVAHKELLEKLIFLNKKHFNIPFKKLKLSPTTSRWGSCSSSGTISISSYLLAAPEKVVEAVMIHELAHGIEMNHSKRFWDLVYTAMPDYDQHHNWLKKNGNTLVNFVKSN